jgi:hypothetical protein
MKYLVGPLLLAAVIAFVWISESNRPVPQSATPVVRDMTGAEEFRSKSDCVGGEAYRSYCDCTIDYVLTMHTAAELKTLDGTAFADLMRDASESCMSRLYR